MLSVFIWWLLVEIIALAALPLAFRLFRHLPDRGYTLAKPLGLLVVSYVTWLAVVFGFLRNTRGAIAFVVVVVGAGAWALYRRGSPDDTGLWDWVRANRRVIIASEVLFALAFVGWAAFRAYNPDISATEKPMEFAFLNSILRSQTFPPPDPWLSGFAISYYYFGYLMMAFLTKLSGLPSAITFNLGIALLFALTATGAFGLVYNLVRGAGDKTRDAVAGIVYGVWGSLLVVVMGNLEGVLEVLHARGWGSDAFWQWIDVRNLAEAPRCETWLPCDNWWWWRASRVIHDRGPLGQHQEVIDEFPFFSFMLGDMHPHVLALPFVFLALGLALNVWRAPARPGPSRLEPLSDLFVMYPLCLGALGFLNTWDLPIYLFIFLLAFALQRFRHYRHVGLEWLKDVGYTAVLVFGLGLGLYLPFYIGFQSQAGGPFPVLFNKTKLHQYFIVFGPFLVVIAGFLLIQLAGWWRARRGWVTRGDRLIVVIGLLAVAGSALFTRWLAATLAVLMTVAWLALWRHADAPASEEDAARSSVVFALLLIFVGLLLTFSTEFVLLRDTFFGSNPRMNTIFKFYYQAWVLMAVASAFGLYYVLERTRHAARWLLAVAFVPLFLAGMVYPVAAGFTKADGFARPPTLDGLRFMAEYYPDDYAAIQWLQANVPDSPVIAEAPGGSYSMYGRVSAQTGLPTVLGWGGHELQWRGSYDEPGKREPDLEKLYKSLDPQTALTIIEKYDITYVYVGSLEREKYGPAGLDKFRRFMDVVYEQGGVTIYRK